jgi:hypothetical protein
MAMLLKFARAQPKPFTSLSIPRRSLSTESSSASSSQSRKNNAEKNHQDAHPKSAAASLRGLPSKAKESIKNIVKGIEIIS